MYFFVAQLSMAFARLTFQGGFFGLIPASRWRFVPCCFIGPDFHIHTFFIYIYNSTEKVVACLKRVSKWWVSV